jgi:hypothetical protein
MYGLPGDVSHSRVAMTDDQEYAGALPLFEAAATDMARRIVEALHTLGDPFWTRRRVEPHRVKQIDSNTA